MNKRERLVGTREPSISPLIIGGKKFVFRRMSQLKQMNRVRKRSYFVITKTGRVNGGRFAQGFEPFQGRSQKTPIPIRIYPSLSDLFPSKKKNVSFQTAERSGGRRDSNRVTTPIFIPESKYCFFTCWLNRRFGFPISNLQSRRKGESFFFIFYFSFDVHARMV